MAFLAVIMLATAGFAGTSTAAPVAVSTGHVAGVTPLNSTYPGGCTRVYASVAKANVDSCIHQAGGPVEGDFWIYPSSSSPQVYTAVATTFTYLQTSATGTSTSSLVVAAQYNEKTPFNARQSIHDFNYSFTPTVGKYYRELTIFQVALTNGGKIYKYQAWSPALRA